uniref:C-type lectin domain-containing protein n=1 Tax=Knipowitschia caucasica TaxID=637954 RepID=A0AAV2M3V5_KNICA
MSCHIYEGPDPETKTVRFSTRPQQDREERVVEIQQSADGGLLEPHQVARRPQTWSGPNPVWLMIIASGLFLLCVIQLFAVVSRTYHWCLCPEHWTRFHCSCLSVFLEKKTWNLSRADCEQSGADLIVIDSREKEVKCKNSALFGEEHTQLWFEWFLVHYLLMKRHVLV